MRNTISFSPPMMAALLRKAKTQTRRLIGRGNSYVDGSPCSKAFWAGLDFASPKVYTDDGPSPAGNPGPYLHVPHAQGTTHRVYPAFAPVLRVKEALWRDMHGWILYEADNAPMLDDDGQARQWGWKPEKLAAMYCPAWASRFQIRVTVRVERLGDISEEDAIAEGAVFVDFGKDTYGQQRPGWRCDRVPTSHDESLGAARFAYGNLWDSLNGHGAWNENPLVWVLSFPAGLEAIR